MSQIDLLGLSPSIEGLRWQTELRLRIGRQPNLDIVIDDPSLGKQHAEIRVTPQGWVLQDLESGNGTLLNGVPIGRLSRKLQLEDVVQCGHASFMIERLKWESPSLATAWSQDIKTSGAMVQIKAFSQLSWEQGLRELSLEEVPIPHAKQFITLLRAGYHMSHIDSVNELLQTLLDDTVAVLNAKRGAIVLANGTTGQLALKTFTGSQSGASNRVYSTTLVQRCFSKGESLLCLDHEPQLRSSASLVSGQMTSIICALLRSPRRRLGVLHLDRGPGETPFTQEDFKLADAIAATVSVGIESAVGVEKQKAQFVQEVVELAQQALALRDPASAMHGQRVCAIALQLAEVLRLTATEKSQLQLGALLHDLGKIGLDDRALKRDPAHEMLARAHPLHGVALAEKIAGFAPALPIIRSHHERWDGAGYPDGLKGNDIPRLARIVAIADALDHWRADYPDSSPTQIASFFQAESGKRFDPEIIAVCQRNPSLWQAPIAAAT